MGELNFWGRLRLKIMARLLRTRIVEVKMRAVIAGWVRHALTAAAAVWLVDIVGPDGVESIIQLVSAIAVGALGLLWSYIQKRVRL